MAGSTALIAIEKKTFDSLRVRNHQIDQALLSAEDIVAKKGIPQIDYSIFNENSKNWSEEMKNNRNKYKVF